MAAETCELSFSRWRHLADKALSARFAITIEDAGMPEDDLRKSWQSGQTAQEYITWYGEKYDLTRLKEWRKIILP